jgi:N-acetylglucosaminyl-diphospho-decaprenol L-rhamnosyltransferase
MESASRRVSVVVLTHNRRSEVERTIRRLKELPSRPSLIVVDNASTDGTPDALHAAFDDLQIIRLTRNIGGAGRNIGLAAARTPYVAFCDDDTWWAPMSLHNAARRLDQDPRLAVVTGRVLVGESQRVDEMCEEMARTPLGDGDEERGYPVLGFLAGASMVRRDAFLSVGGFSERYFIGGEEELVALDLAARGWSIRYASDVVVHHYPSAMRDPSARRRIMLRNSLWTAILRYPGWLLLRHGRGTAHRARSHRMVLPLIVDTVRAAPWLVTNRRQLPHHVVRQLLLLQDAKATGV